MKNLTVFTGDVSVFQDEQFQQAFDRVISIGKSMTIVKLVAC